MAAQLREAMAARMSGLFGEEICTTYVASGDDMMAHATIGGERGDPPEPVIWVRPDEGYRVEP
jgi:hypothetical protein